MSSIRGSFPSQQAMAMEKHPNQRANNMDDKEKIELLKGEIDSLRSQIRDSGAVPTTAKAAVPSSPATSSTSASSSSIGSNVASVSLFFLVLLGLVTVWKRRSSSRRVYGGLSMASGVHGQVPQEDDMGMTFELHTQPQISVVDNSSLGYAAPAP
eukprot:Nitzschia sp. Nitz4//scaffold262_size27079//1346//1810//NITZ4_008216-RA/size27079-processed-gene-0.4-mRNA-1//-1//CDS//3329544739//4725//frame0